MPVMVEPQIRGAVYQGARRRNDNLRMALAVGQILNDHGVDVGYTRVQDVYQSPLRRPRWQITGTRITLYHFTEMPCQFPEPLLEQKA